MATGLNVAAILAAVGTDAQTLQTDAGAQRKLLTEIRELLSGAGIVSGGLLEEVAALEAQIPVPRDIARVGQGITIDPASLVLKALPPGAAFVDASGVVYDEAGSQILSVSGEKAPQPTPGIVLPPSIAMRIKGVLYDTGGIPKQASGETATGPIMITPVLFPPRSEFHTVNIGGARRSRRRSKRSS